MTKLKYKSCVLWFLIAILLEAGEENDYLCYEMHCRTRISQSHKFIYDILREKDSKTKNLQDKLLNMKSSWNLKMLNLFLEIRDLKQFFFSFFLFFLVIVGFILMVK